MDIMVVKDQSSNRVFAVFRVDDGRLAARGVGAGIEWAKWATRRNLNLEQVLSSLDPSLSVSKETATSELLSLFNQQEEVSVAKIKSYQDWSNKTAMHAIEEKARRRRGFGRGLAGGLAAGLRNIADAVDGDGDGKIGDGTPMERPAPSDPTGNRPRVLDRVIEAVAQGAEAVEAVAGNREGREDLRDRAEAALLRQLREIADAGEEGEAFEERLAALVRPGGARAAARRARERVGEELRRLRDGVVETLHGPFEGVAPDGPMPRRTDVPGLLRGIARKGRAVGRRTGAGYALPHIVPDGNKGIDSDDKAIQAVKDGMDLAEIPDAYLAKAILDNTGSDKRFKIIATDGSINSPSLVEDTLNPGQKYVVKYSNGSAYGGNEDLAEILGGHLQERFGFHAGTVRFGGKPLEISGPTRKKAVPLVISAADEHYGPDYKTGKQKFRNLDRNEWLNGISVSDLVGMTLLDAAILNSDRHWANYLVADDEDGVRHIIPIDNGLGFNGRDTSGRAGGMGGFNHEATERNLVAWLNDGMGGYRAANTILKTLENTIEADPEAVLEEIKAFQARLKELEAELPFEQVVQEMWELTGREGAPIGAFETAAARVNLIMNMDPERLLDLLKRNRRV